MTFEEDFKILKNLYKNREEKRFQQHFATMMSVYGKDEEVQKTLLSWVEENLGEMDKKIKETKKELEDLAFKEFLDKQEIL